MTEEKQANVQDQGANLLSEMARGRGWVSLWSLKSFSGVVSSFHQALPSAPFYILSIHDFLKDFSEADKSVSPGGERFRLSGGNGQRGKTDLKERPRLGQGGGRFFVERDPQRAVHKDAADLG